ncbi:PIN domain-containing protein [Roseateles sp. SL47]|uniref:PIN domain-containing protein n=1 Tax=Roseateles sp. SL47 TaxID=2995138 RepID=UPI002270000E|nr:PIN domain-containing protein [Roseateles sp. SL47]WAC73655.1 PIN domain-containing protein [Roseateles sp. SL47]
MNPAVLPSLPPASPIGPLPLRVVLDTQIVMDWLVFDEPRIRPIIARVESRHLLWTATAPMKAEMLHVLGRGVAARYSPDLARIHAAFQQHCEFIEVPVLGISRPRCSDEDDQKFIDLALHLAVSQPTVLLSRDRAVLKVAKRAAKLGLSILSPDAWLQRHATTALTDLASQ